jgi:hypothetical protein
MAADPEPRLLIVRGQAHRGPVRGSQRREPEGSDGQDEPRRRARHDLSARGTLGLVGDGQCGSELVPGGGCHAGQGRMRAAGTFTAAGSQCRRSAFIGLDQRQ